MLFCDTGVRDASGQQKGQTVAVRVFQFHLWTIEVLLLKYLATLNTSPPALIPAHATAVN